MRKRTLPKVVFSCLVIGTILMCFITTVSAETPTLQMFPKEVTSYIKETGQEASSLENGVRGPIAIMEKNMKLYNATGCDKVERDPGCESIIKNINNNYNKMLDVMAASLPKMKRSIKKTNTSLKKRIHSNMGKRMTPADLQRAIGKSAAPKVRKGRYSLSKRFAQYNKLIASKGNNNLTDLASDMYLDSASVIEWIDLMEGQIAQQKTLIEIGQMYGGINDEMIGVVGSVKNVIFGEEGDYENAELPDPSTVMSSEDAEMKWNY